MGEERGGTAWEAPPEARVSGRGGPSLPVKRGLPAWAGGCGRAAFCTEIFLFCNWAVRGLAQGHHLWALLLETQGRPHPCWSWRGDRTDLAAPTPCSGSPWGGGESAIISSAQKRVCPSRLEDGDLGLREIRDLFSSPVLPLVCLL